MRNILYTIIISLLFIACSDDDDKDIYYNEILNFEYIGKTLEEIRDVLPEGGDSGMYEPGDTGWHMFWYNGKYNLYMPSFLFQNKHCTQAGISFIYNLVRHNDLRDILSKKYGEYSFDSDVYTWQYGNIGITLKKILAVSPEEDAKETTISQISYEIL